VEEYDPERFAKRGGVFIGREALVESLGLSNVFVGKNDDEDTDGVY
jgi:hypothetical protein